MRFSPLLSALGASERFSPKDLFIPILFQRDSRGASMRFSPLPSALGASERFSPKDIFIMIFSFLFFSFLDAQGMPKTEAEPFSMTSTDFSTVLMNSCLERGFL